MINDINPIFEAYLSDQFEPGLERFSSLESPNAEDVLWAGQCFFGLDRNVQALDCFYRAHALGLEEGLVFAATILRFCASGVRAEALLRQVDQSKLSSFGRAIWRREYGLQLFAGRQLLEAQQELEHAWQLAASDQLGRRLLPRYSQSLSLVLLELGRDSAALKYLDVALEQIPTNPGVLLLRATARAYAAELAGAQADLDTFERLAASADRARAGLVHGFLARTNGLIEKAASIYLETASNAKELVEWETELYAELALSALLTEQGDLYVAQAHLARARGLIPKGQASSLTFEAILAVRHAALLTRHGNSEAIKVLEEAIVVLESRDLERDAGIAHLHLAEANFQANQQSQGFQALARAVNARHALGSRAYFALELRALPHVFEVVCATQQPGTEILREDWALLEAQSPQEVRLLTLGRYAIEVNGQAIKLEAGTSKAIEFLAYLLEVGESKIDSIIDALFLNGSHASARNRIHKLRESIAAQIPGLTIPFDKTRNTYQIQPLGVRLRWDVRVLRQHLEQGGSTGLKRALAVYSGAFLPSSDLEWVEHVRYQLEFSLAKLGIEAMRDLFDLERYEECLRLGERLAEIAALNIGVQLMVLKATSRLHGRLAARARLERVDPMIREDIKALPEVRFELEFPEPEHLN